MEDFLCNAHSEIRNKIVMYCNQMNRDIHISVGIEERLTQNGKKFWIYKFRSMITNAEQDGARIEDGKKNAAK